MESKFINFPAIDRFLWIFFDVGNALIDLSVGSKTFMLTILRDSKIIKIVGVF
jgi:hypothetical protein